jgi:hypothetical protein
MKIIIFSLSILIVLNSWTVKYSLLIKANSNNHYFVIDTDGDGVVDSIDLDDDNDGVSDFEEQDTNNDGVITAADNQDVDGDGILNQLDLDSDNDGIPDTRENGLADANGDGKIDGFVDANGDGLNDGTAIGTLDDFDGDGILNQFDLDSDNDGITDVKESGGSDSDANGQIGTGVGFSIPDSDNDGLKDIVDPIAGYTGITVGTGVPSPIPNTDSTTGADYLDIDADNDGIVDNIEGQTTVGYISPSQLDADADGILDTYDLTIGFSGTGINLVNTEGADTPDYIDLNSDNDVLTDLQENGLAAPSTTDADGDGMLDSFDTFSGGANLGSVANITNGNQTPNSFPNTQNPSTPQRDWREAPTDTDSDGIPDTFDVDDDNDGILDIAEGTGDADGEGIPDNLDLDSDGDGIPDVIEAGGADSNGDGLIDCYMSIGSSNVNASGLVICLGGVGLLNIDTDGDGKPNSQDLDSDNDGITDILEVGGVDTNGDGKVDNTIDSDGDGLVNVADPTNGRDPGSPTSGATPETITNTDTNSDGKPNGNPLTDNFDGDALQTYLDIDSDNDGITDVKESGGIDANNDGKIDGTDTNGDGLIPSTGTIPFNTDGSGALADSKHDYLDIDADNDGIVDNIEGQTTAGYITPTGTDADVDGLDNAYDLIGAAGITPTNSDFSDVPDYRDINSDNDSLTDIQENGVISIPTVNADTDGDGLLDGYDNSPSASALGTVNNITNGNQTPLSFPNIEVPSTPERDWRESPGSVFLFNMNNNSLIKLYPNPFVDKLNIVSDKQIQNYKITDLSGRLITDRVAQRLQFEIEMLNLQKGVYLIQLYFEDEVKTYRISKD